MKLIMKPTVAERAIQRKKESQQPQLQENRDEEFIFEPNTRGWS